MKNERARPCVGLCQGAKQTSNPTTKLPPRSSPLEILYNAIIHQLPDSLVNSYSTAKPQHGCSSMQAAL